MSVHAASWAWKQKTGDAGAKLVLMKLADQSNDRGECWPSQKTLADECEMSRRTVQRKLEILYGLGFMECEQRTRATGGDTSLLYRIKPPAVRQSDAPPYDTGDAPPTTQVTHHEPSLEPISPSEDEESDAVAPREPDEIWEILEKQFGRVERGAEKTQAHGRRNKAVIDLKRLEATAGSVRHAIGRWSFVFPGATLTDIALATHFPQLTAGYSPAPAATGRPLVESPELSAGFRLQAAAESVRFQLRRSVCGECEVGSGGHADWCSSKRETSAAAYRRFVEETAPNPDFALTEIAAVVSTWSDLDDVDRQELAELAEQIRSTIDRREAA